MPMILPVTAVRERLSALLDQVTSNGEPIFITRQGRAQAVLLSAAQYDLLIKRLAQTGADNWYLLSQASLARIWEHPDEEVYTWEDGAPL